MDVTAIKPGQMITFAGYSETPEEGMDQLVEGQKYEVVEINKEDNSVVVKADNPDFNPKKKVSESNAEHILLDVFFEELKIDEPDAKAKGKGKADAAKTTEAPAKGKPAAKTEAKAPSKAVAKTAAKGKAPAKAKNEVANTDEEAADPYADLHEDQEDQEILELVNAAEDVLELAREIAEESSALEYRMGGILFHVRKSGAYKDLDSRYAEKGGFSLYLLEQLNIEYRKAMYLVDIYYKWNKFGLEASKVAAIGWAKAAKIAAVMTEENADELLELAETKTVADLVDNIKTNYKVVGATGGTRARLSVFKFKLFEDSAAAVEEVLSSVAASMGFKKIDEAFEHIIMEWATEHPTSAPETTKAATSTRNTGKAQSAKAKAKN